MTREHIKDLALYSFTEESVTTVSTNSTTQSTLITTSGNPEVFVVSNPSVIKPLWIKSVF